MTPATIQATVTIAEGWKGHYYMLHRLGGLLFLEYSPCEVVRVYQKSFGMIFPAIPSRCSIDMKPITYPVKMNDVAEKGGNYDTSEKALLRHAVSQTTQVAASMEKELKGYTRAHEKYAYFQYQLDKLRSYNAALRSKGFAGIKTVDASYRDREKKLRAALWGMHR